MLIAETAALVTNKLRPFALGNHDVTRLRECLLIERVGYHLADGVSRQPCFENLTDVEVEVLRFLRVQSAPPG